MSIGRASQWPLGDVPRLPEFIAVHVFRYHIGTQRRCVPPTPVERPMTRRSRMMASCFTCWEVRHRCGYKTRLMRWDGSGAATTVASFENGVELAHTHRRMSSP